MEYSQFFPFLNMANVIKTEFVEDFDLTNERYLNFPKVRITDESIMESIADKTGVADGAYVQLVKVVPNNVYLYVGNDPELDVL